MKKINKKFGILMIMLVAFLGASPGVFAASSNTVSNTAMTIVNEGTGSSIDITSSGVFAAELFDINTTGAWTGNLFDVDASTAISEGNVIDITYSGVAHSGNALDINMGTAVAGAALDIDLTGARSDAGIDLASDATGAGDTLDFNVSGTQSGDILHIDVTGAITGSAIEVVNSNTGTVDGDLLFLDNDEDRAGGSIIQIDDVADGTASAPTIDVNLTGATDQPALDITFSAIATSGGNAIDLNMATAVAVDAINIDTEATGGRAIAIDSGGVFTDSLIFVDASAGAWTGDMLKFKTGDIAGTGDVVSVEIEATAVEAKALAVENAAASTRQGWLLAATTTGVFTGNAIDFDVSSGASTGDIINVAMGTNVAGDVINIDTEATGGHAILIDSGGVFTDSLIDIDASGGAWTGNMIEITTGDVAATGDVFNIDLEDSAVAAQIFTVANTAITTQDGWLLGATSTAAWTGNMIDFDIETAAATGNIFDVTFTDAAQTGNVLDFNMGTNVAGNAIDIDTEATGGRAITIDSGGVFTNELIMVDASGGAWTGSMLQLKTGDVAATGNVIDVEIEATAVAAQAFEITNAAASDRYGWLIGVTTTGVTTGNMIYVDDNNTQTGSGIVLDYAALTTGDVMKLEDSDGNRTTGHVLAIDDAGDGTLDTGSTVHITQSAAADHHALEIDTAGVGAADEGQGIDVVGSGALVDGSSLVHINAGGSNVAGSYALHIEAANDAEGLHVDSGGVVFDENATSSLDFVVGSETNNATTTLSIKTDGSPGSCIEMYDTADAPVIHRVYLNGTTMVIEAGTCK